jgi:hypothetical protein
MIAIVVSLILEHSPPLFNLQPPNSLFHNAHKARGSSQIEEEKEGGEGAPKACNIT